MGDRFKKEVSPDMTHTTVIFQMGDRWDTFFRVGVPSIEGAGNILMRERSE
jgi:hypothetical protein